MTAPDIPHLLDLPTVDLPAGVVAAPLAATDAAAVAELMAAQEEHDLGEVHVEEADIVADWQHPAFDVARDTVGLRDAAGTLVAYAELGTGDRTDAAVLPAWRGRGLGRWLAQWLRAQGTTAGRERIGAPVPQGSAADRLLTRLGYHERWRSWVLELPGGTAIPSRPLPAGYDVGAAEVGEYPVVLDVVEDAFLEWSRRDRQTFAEFEATVLRRPGFEPWHLRVVRDPHGVVVGVAVMTFDPAIGVGYLSRLAVRADQRGRGLAQALMADGFAVARAHGATRSELSTDSRTGALPLYERMGMVVTSTWVHRAVWLRIPAEA